MRLIFGIATRMGSQSFMTEISADGLSPLEKIPYEFVNAEFSFDGLSMAYDNCGDPRSNSRGIYVAKLASHTSRKILPLTNEVCVSVRWAPDGQRLSFNSPDDHQLHIINLATRKESILPNSEVGWHWWSPKGDQIVFERGRGGDRKLFITDLEGHERQLTYLKDFKNCETWAPTWSRDGSRIAFTITEASKKMSLCTIAPDGTEIKRLETPEIAYSPRWSLDSEWILFLSGERLVRIRKDGTGLSSIGDLQDIKSPFSLGPQN